MSKQISKQTSKQTNKQISKQTSKQTNKQTNKQTKEQTNNPSSALPHIQPTISGASNVRKGPFGNVRELLDLGFLTLLLLLQAPANTQSSTHTDDPKGRLFLLDANKKLELLVSTHSLVLLLILLESAEDCANKRFGVGAMNSETTELYLPDCAHTLVLVCV
jgi:cobalamin-dependent methionine synthase I